MYSFLNRLNALATFGVFGLLILTTLASLSDYMHEPKPQVTLTLRGVDRLSRLGAERGSGGSGADEAQLSMALQADMRSVFSWNTKQIFMFVQAEYATEDNRRNQVSVWDRIIEHKEDAVLNLPHVRNKYRFIDADADLRGRPFNLTLTWNVMNKVGGTYFDSHTVPDLVLPTEYDTAPPPRNSPGRGRRGVRGGNGALR